MNTRATTAPLAAALLVGCSGASPASLVGGVGGVGDAGGASIDATTASSDAGAPTTLEAGGAVPAGLDAAVADGASVATTSAGGDGAAAVDAAPVAPLPSLHVVGNRIYDNDTPVVLTGVHRAGTEYACVHGTGFFDGPSDTASVQAMKTWTRASAVRVPLNEDCWLGINGVPTQYSGQAYRAAIAAYVTVLLENGLYPILDLHWSAPGAQLAMAPATMPDQDHAPAFWSQVAATFKDNLGVAFDLFDAPDPAGGQETTDAWACWRDGSQAGDAGACSAVGFAVSGMQSLLTAVRSAGAANLVLLGGVVGGNALSQWTVYKPQDPANNVAAAWHAFADSPCSATSCFDSKVAPVAQLFPVVAAEIGESDCQGSFIASVTSWLDTQGQGYLAFAWDAWPGNCQALIADYAGTPTVPYGQAYKNHLEGNPADAGGD